jgi:uncharacterized membrane protein YdbT with pleckstrin-like domain
VPFPRKLLNEDEQLVLDLHPHWWFFIGPLTALVASLALGVYLKVGRFDPPGVVLAAAGVLILVCLVWFGIRYARWSTTNFALTTDRIVYRHGVLGKKGIEIPLDRVNTVFFSQTILERMLGAGDLVIESAGESGREEFSNVRKPSAVQNELYKQMEANENRKFDRVGKSGGQFAGKSIPEQIEQLDELRRRGTISDSEFEAKKAQLLDRM